MHRHTPRIYTAAYVIDRALAHNDPTDFPEIIGADGEPRSEIAGKWFVLDWPDHCVTCSHLNDATIHGPYATEDEARSNWPNAD